MIEPKELAEIELGVVGLGLMGSSIVVALLIAGHPVRGVAPIPTDLVEVELRIKKQLEHAGSSGILAHSPTHYLSRLTLSEDFGTLKGCRLVQECVVENVDIKGAIYRKIADATGDEVIISSNTSAIPISVLQDRVPCPERFLGIHWAEPAYLTRFLEITKGEKTAEEPARWVFDLAHHWDKEPTFLQKDIRGFVTNRLMYAVYREAFHLIEMGEATIEDVDKSFRYDAGSWITKMGLMKRMDFLGLSDFGVALERLFPTLSQSSDVPDLMKKMIASEAKGIQNSKGLYKYTKQEAEAWGEAFAAFNKEIYKLAADYPSVPTE